MKIKSQKENEIKKQLLKEIESLKDKKGFIQAGFPKYLGLFGRDSLIVAWQLLDYDSLIAKNTLLVLAELQGKKIDFKTEEEPGKILHEYYPKNTSDDWWKKYKAKSKWLKKGKIFYMSADSTFLFLIILAKYFQKTKDKEFLLKIWPNVKRAINWILDYSDINKDGFFDYQKKNLHGLSNQGWKDSNYLKIKPPVAIVEIQGYAFIALKEIAKLAKIVEDKKLADKLLEKSKVIKEKFNQEFWMEKQKYFALGLNGEKKQIKIITSNPGHLLFTGILNKNKEKAVIKKLFSSDLWTPYGIRTHSVKEPGFNTMSYHKGSIWPHDNWIIAQGLKKLGYKKEYKKVKTSILKAYQELGFIPELYGFSDNKIRKISNVCYPQAWASSSLYNFLS